MKKIYTEKAPAPVGPYSQGFVSNNLVFCAGQIGINPMTGELAEGDVEKQTRQTIKNIDSILQEAGSSLKKVIKTTCYLKNMSDYKKFNDVYANYFSHKPARATVAVTALPKDALIEIEVVAEM